MLVIAPEQTHHITESIPHSISLKEESLHLLASIAAGNELCCVLTQVDGFTTFKMFCDSTDGDAAKERKLEKKKHWW